MHFDGFDGIAVSDLATLGPYTPTGTLVMVAGRYASLNAQAVQTSAAANTSDGLTVNHAVKAIVLYGFACSFGGSAAIYRIFSGRNGATEAFNLVRNTTGTISLRAGTSTTALATSAAVLTSNSNFYYVEVEFNYPGSGNPTVNVRVNGTVVLTYTGSLNSVVSLNRCVYGFSFSTVQVAPAFTVDDIYILDTLGAVNNAFLGDVRVELLTPAATDFNDGFTPTGAATNHEAVDEALQDGDTTYAFGTAVGQDIDFTIAPLTNVPSAIFAVAVQSIGKKTDVGVRSTTTRLKSAAATATGTAHTLSDSAYTASPFQIVETDPDGGIAWTRAKVEAAKIGVEITA